MHSWEGLSAHLHAPRRTHSAGGLQHAVEAPAFQCGIRSKRCPGGINGQCQLKLSLQRQRREDRAECHHPDDR